MAIRTLENLAAMIDEDLAEQAKAYRWVYDEVFYAVAAAPEPTPQPDPRALRRALGAALDRAAGYAEVSGVMSREHFLQRAAEAYDLALKDAEEDEEEDAALPASDPRQQVMFGGGANA